MRKARRLVILIVIFASLGVVAYKVTETIWTNKAREFRKNPLKALDYLPDSALHIKDFRRAKIEDGRKVWELLGDEAHYLKEQKEAIVKKPRFYFYDKRGDTAEAFSNEGHLFFDERELQRLELQGGIHLSYQGFTLKSEEAIYHPNKEQIVLPKRVTLVGDGLELEGSSMEVQLDEQKMRVQKNVKTKLEPDKLAKRKKRPDNSAASGG
jgi:LPS export ABC transporter protein LptC